VQILGITWHPLISRVVTKEDYRNQMRFEGVFVGFIEFSGSVEVVVTINININHVVSGGVGSVQIADNVRRMSMK